MFSPLHLNLRKHVILEIDMYGNKNKLPEPVKQVESDVELFKSEVTSTTDKLNVEGSGELYITPTSEVSIVTPISTREYVLDAVNAEGAYRLGYKFSCVLVETTGIMATDSTPVIDTVTPA